MLKTIIRRLLLLIGTLLLVTVLAFVAFSIIPGDPTSAVLGVDATPEQIAALRARLGLDLPVLLALGAAAFLPPLLWGRFFRWQGAALLGVYAGYVALLVA